MPWESPAQGPGSSLAQLFQNHRNGLAGAVRGVLGSRADVAEVLQEAYVKALSAQRRGARPGDPVAWIFVVTLNAARDLRRQAHRSQHRALDEVAMEMQTHEAPAAQVEREEALRFAQAAIEQLQDAEKEVFLLRVSGELTFEATGAGAGHSGRHRQDSHAHGALQAAPRAGDPVPERGRAEVEPCNQTGIQKSATRWSRN